MSASVHLFQNKCARYWPDSNESKTYDKIHVLNLKEISNPHYVVREFLLNHDSEVSYIHNSRPVKRAFRTLHVFTELLSLPNQLSHNYHKMTLESA